MPRCAFLSQLALHHHLRGDAGVVGAWQPQGFSTGHAAPARENVHLSLVEHVAHVQAASDVGRRQQDGKRGLAVQALVLVGVRAGAGRRNGEEFFADPVAGPVIFNGGRVVGFGQIVRHGFRREVPEKCANSRNFQSFYAQGLR